MIPRTPWAKKTAFLLSSLGLLCVATVTLACCQQTAVPTAPTDQTLQGPFKLTTEWQTFALDKPFMVIPHSQDVRLLLPGDDYEYVTIYGSESRYVSLPRSRLKRLADHHIIKPEVILVTRQGQEFRTSYSSRGSYTHKNFGFMMLLSFGIDSKRGIYYPEGTEFVALKMRANTPMEIPYIEWDAGVYYRAPNRTWDDVHPSKIVNLDTVEPVLPRDVREEIEAIAPADQLLEGPFKLTTKWQTITLDKPLKVIPYTQTLELMLPMDDYQGLDVDEPKSRYVIEPGRFKRLADQKITQPEVILVTKQGQEFRTTYGAIGSTRHYKGFGTFWYLGFRTSFVMRKFYYPKGTEFVAIKVRANTPMEIPYIGWFANLYSQDPYETWDDVDSSAIISFD